ncbi:MAG: N-6 DNA methylase, partial [Candidatus Omnitrophica bacterium]|nr:N-6 DNA methylase [Candidatus Omnitrophota bacterium]
GRIDNLFGNLVIEFKRNLETQLSEAERQLKKYIAILWGKEAEKISYICIATDGLNFSVYSPKIKNIKQTSLSEENIELILIEKINIERMEPNNFYFWLDRYFCREEILSPTTENIVKDFGINSHSFQTIQNELLLLWQKVKKNSDFKVIYENWSKYLRLVYGSDLSEEELFCKHTYLSILAKLIVWRRFDDSFYDNNRIKTVLEGRFFKDFGIINFLEEDFFSWICRKETEDKGIEIARKLLSILSSYNLRGISEDVLKSLYEQLVDPKTRHDLGEFYTPDWLAHRIVSKLIEKNKKGSFIDPACGSGTFLYFIIKEKREKLKDSIENSAILHHILKTVVGIDIHPLACTIAKANYILALGDLLRKRRGKINIPIYLADSIKLPKKDALGNKIILENEEVYIPDEISKDPIIYDTTIETIKNFVLKEDNLKEDKIDETQFSNYIRKQIPNIKEINNLLRLAKVLKSFIKEGKDTIWAFILKNTYKPIILLNKFDFVVGNPPWLVYRNAEPNYKKFISKEVKEYNLLQKKGGHLITHLELGTLFFIKAIDLYLKEKGIIGFVLPKSIFNADHHFNLRKGDFKRVNITFKEIWDLEKVSPLFNIPAIVIIGEKEKNAKICYPIDGEIIEGELDKKNSKLEEAEEKLKFQKVNFYLQEIGKRSYITTEEYITTKESSSYYKEHFYQGATIVPRVFWFIDIKSSEVGFDVHNPFVETSFYARKKAKEPYRNLKIEGQIEDKFIYATLLSNDILPFGLLEFRPVILPIEPSGNKYKIITQEEAKKKGYFHLAEWLKKVEENWNKEKITAVGWLNYRNKLTNQNPNIKYRVIYPTVGKIMGCRIKNKPVIFKINGQEITAKGILCDTKTYYYETDDENESLFLLSLLNAPILEKKIKPAKAMRGETHKKVFELPIPKFNLQNELHIQLVKLGKECEKKVENWLKSQNIKNVKSIGILRRKVRKEVLEKELKEIDNIVKKLLNIQ